MELVADALLIAGAVGAAAYCRTLAKRLGALRDLDSGLGAAIAALSRQVDEMRATLDTAKSVSGDHTREIAQLAARAEMAAGRLELLLASLHEGGERRSIQPRSPARAPRRDALREADTEPEAGAVQDRRAEPANGRGADRRAYAEPTPAPVPQQGGTSFFDDEDVPGAFRPSRRSQWP